MQHIQAKIMVMMESFAAMMIICVASLTGLFEFIVISWFYLRFFYEMHKSDKIWWNS